MSASRLGVNAFGMEVLALASEQSSYLAAMPLGR